MAKGVLALTINGDLTYCVAPEEKRGIGRCKHVAHQNPGESTEDFIQRVQPSMNSEGGEEETMEERITRIVKDNALSFNKNPDWNKALSPLISRYFRMGENISTGEVLQEQVTLENGDIVTQLTLRVEYEGETHECDFGQVPFVKDDGTISINGVEYRCLPVVSRNKVAYGQGYSGGKPMIWLYQESGDLAVSIPLEGDTCRILGKEYPLNEIIEAINNPPHKDDRIASVLASIDHRIYDRLPNFGKDGDSWVKELRENFSSDKINDLEWRRIYTYEDQVMKELEAQMKRMGVTFRKGISTDGVPILFQKNNTENVKGMLTGRSNVQMAENLNELAAYSQSHKISLVGIEGYNKDNCPDELRVTSESYRGMTEPLDQSSGKGIGLSVFIRNADVVDGVLKRNPERKDLALTDFVPNRRHNKPNRITMSTSQLRQATPLTNGEEPRKTGDKESDEAWNTIKGAKLGVNLKTVLLPGEKEWDDSARISESAAKKLECIKTFKFAADEKFKEGDFVKKGTKIAGKEVKYDGVLKRHRNGGFTMDVAIGFNGSDKIAGRYGDKCTVGRIVPDDEMPKIWNPDTRQYEPAELVKSPLSIGKRGNLGVVLELQNGSLKEEDIVPVILPDGKTVKANNGFQYIMRLNQIAEEKNYSFAGQLQKNGEAHSRFGEMESILLTTTEKKRKVLNYLKNQGIDRQGRADSLFKAIGVKREIVKYNGDENED